MSLQLTLQFDSPAEAGPTLATGEYEFLLQQAITYRDLVWRAYLVRVPGTGQPVDQFSVLRTHTDQPWVAWCGDTLWPHIKQLRRNFAAHLNALPDQPAPKQRQLTLTKLLPKRRARSKHRR